jgi:hypothetical protein
MAGSLPMRRMVAQTASPEHPVGVEFEAAAG